MNQVQFDSMAFKDRNETCEMKPKHFGRNLAKKSRTDRDLKWNENYSIFWINVKCFGHPNTKTEWNWQHLTNFLRGRLFAWLLLCLKQPQQTWCLVTLKTQFNCSGSHAISRFGREFYKAADSCFVKFCVYVHSAIHLHCSSELFLFFFFKCV